MAGGILLFVFVVFSSRLSWSKVQVGPSLGFGIPEPILSLRRRLRLAGAERGSRASGMIYYIFQPLRARLLAQGRRDCVARIVLIDFDASAIDRRAAAYESPKRLTYESLRAQMS